MTAVENLNVEKNISPIDIDPHFVIVYEDETVDLVTVRNAVFRVVLIAGKVYCKGTDYLKSVFCLTVFVFILYMLQLPGK